MATTTANRMTLPPRSQIAVHRLEQGAQRAALRLADGHGAGFRGQRIVRVEPRRTLRPQHGSGENRDDDAEYRDA